MSFTEDDKKWLMETFATKRDLERVETSLLTEFHKMDVARRTTPAEPPCRHASI
jgi:hypothetical protein